MKSDRSGVNMRLILKVFGIFFAFFSSERLLAAHYLDGLYDQNLHQARLLAQ